MGRLQQFFKGVHHTKTQFNEMGVLVSWSREEGFFIGALILASGGLECERMGDSS